MPGQKGHFRFAKVTMLKKTYIIDDPLDKSLWDQMFLSGVFTDLVASGEPLPDDFLIWMLDQGLFLFCPLTVLSVMLILFTAASLSGVTRGFSVCIFPDPSGLFVAKHSVYRPVFSLG